mgnify:CR=1 FL=1
MMQSIKKRVFLPAIILIAAIAADQIIKFAVKLSMFKHESIRVFDWFYIYFVENKGMAFGMAFGGLTGKVLLSVFRIVLFGALCWWIRKLTKNPKTPMGVLVGLTLITAGALGNIIDCFFYGLIWPETIMDGAPFAFLYGQVVDMFYFPLFDYKLPWMEHPQTFFGAVFNFADSCVTVGAIYLLLFHYKFFAKDDEKDKK